MWFFLLFIGLPIALIFLFNIKEWKSRLVLFNIKERLKRFFNEAPECYIDKNDWYVKEMEELEAKHNHQGGLWTKDRERLRELWRVQDEQAAKARLNAGFGAVGAAIAVGSILVDAHNDHQRMLDVDRRK